MLADYGAEIRDHQVWAAERDGVPVGFVVLIRRPDHLLLHNIAVHPDHQGHGIGRTLLEHAEDVARRLRLDQLRLSTNEAMTENLAIYAAQGYVETHRRIEDGYRRIHLTKRLQPWPPRPIDVAADDSSTVVVTGPDLSFRPATAVDVQTLHALRRAAEDWLERQGIHQWRPGAVSAAEIDEQVRLGEWQVAVDGDSINGALRLLWSDETVWPPDTNVAAYVHGLVIDRRNAGTGLGVRILSWAHDQARHAGARVLRLQCVEANARLRRYYTALGFREVGHRSFDAPWPPVTLLEKQITTEPDRRGRCGPTPAT